MDEQEGRRLARIASAIAPESPIDQPQHAASIYQDVRRKLALVNEPHLPRTLLDLVRDHVPEQEKNA